MSPMLDDPQAEAIKRIAEEILAAHSAELVECNVHRHTGGLQLRFLVDTVGGVTVQDCTRLNRLIGEALDASGSVDTNYTLEVSSPGLDRPLVTKRDYERAIGDELDVELLEPLADTKARQLRGRVLAVQEDAVVLASGSGNLTVLFANIQRARKAVRW